MDASRPYDVCFSFAGEDRDYVENVANLRNRDIQVFYDRWEQADLWGKNLFDHLVHVYRDAARYCVLFVSEYYAAKVWTNHERKAAQARALEQTTEYVLPARFDDTPLPGLLATTFYVELRHKTPAELAELIAQKSGPRERRNFFPPDPDELYVAMKATDSASRAAVRERGLLLFDAWTHLKEDERRLIIHMVMHGCRAELPDLVHENIDKIERYTGFDKRKVRRLFRVLGEFGFIFGTRKQKHRGITTSDVTMRFAIFSRRYKQFQTDFAIYVLGGATRGFCEHHAEAALLRCDFGQLASVNEGENHDG